MPTDGWIGANDLTIPFFCFREPCAWKSNQKTVRQNMKGNDRMETTTLEDVRKIVAENGYKDLDPKPSEFEELAVLLQRIAAILNKYVELPKAEYGTLISLWIANTYVYQMFNSCGYLRLKSAIPRCGKSRLLELVGTLVDPPVPIMTMPTAAILFRSQRPVLILDEVDNLRQKDKDAYADILAILNMTYKKGGVIERCSGPNHEVITFDVYRPIALAGIEGIADTLADRCFIIPMKRASTRPPRLNLRKMEKEFTEIRSGLSAWFQKQEHVDLIRKTYDKLPDAIPDLAGYDDRLQDVAEPLFLIATLADQMTLGSNLKTEFLDALVKVSEHREPSGREKGLISFLDIAQQKLGIQEEVFVSSTELVRACMEETDDLMWIDSWVKLKNFLKNFDLSPRQNSSGTKRGYDLKKEWVNEWETRYSKSSENAQAES